MAEDMVSLGASWLLSIARGMRHATAETRVRVAREVTLPSRLSQPHSSEVFMRSLVICSVVGCLIAGCSKGEPAGSSVADEEQVIREIDAAWSRDLHARNLDAVMTNYDDNAVLLASNQPLVDGKAKIREWFATQMERPDYAPTFAPTKIVVARSRDIAYELGRYQLTITNAEGNQVTITGKHLVSWEKRDGRWRVTAESINSDARR